jgi:hypothetical protein
LVKIRRRQSACPVAVPKKAWCLSLADIDPHDQVVARASDLAAQLAKHLESVQCRPFRKPPVSL